jgi:2-keto-myo-inositol isomerase
MKLSYNEATAMKCSTLENDLVLCDKTGFDFIEIRLDLLRDYLRTHTVQELKAFFDNHHIKPHAFNALFYVNFWDYAQRKEVMNDFLLACRTGEKIGSQCVVAVPLITKEPNRRSEAEVFEDSVANLELLAEIGRDYGMKIAFEPVGNEGCCVRTVKQAWDIVKAINDDAVGITLDAFNLYLYHKKNDFSDMKMVPLDKVFVVHIDDSDDKPLEELDHCDRCFPGGGLIDLKNYIRTLKEMKYDGMVSVETFRPEYWGKDPEWVIRTGYETTKRLIESV